MKCLFAAAVLATGFALSPVHAAIVNIDLSGAVSGTTINGIGADFTQSFAGQTVSGTALTGAPTNPLSLQAAGTINVAAFNPFGTGVSNSLLSQPGNAAPLAILFDSDADSFDWTMGSALAGSTVLASFYNDAGTLIGSQVVVMQAGYANYSLAGFGAFRGLTFSDNNDQAGVRFQNMSFNAVTTQVPEPASIALVGLALLAASSVRRTRREPATA